MPARILIIEDNAANLELMGYLLRASGYETLTAEDGEEGLALARSEHPDLIICDVQMPRVDGFELVRTMKSDADLQPIPLIAVTAAAMVGDRDRVLAAGFDGYLAKPIVPETFVQQVVEFISPELRSTSSQQPDTAAVESHTPTPTRHSVLVVDNLQSNLDFACSVLEHHGFRVFTATGMREAMDVVRRTPPDLILSDVCMDEGSGYDFIALVKADPKLKSIPFVFQTSTMSNEREREKGLSLGAMRFLFRPMEPETLLAEVEACLPAKGKG